MNPQTPETAVAVLPNTARPEMGVDIFAETDLRGELAVSKMVFEWAKDNRGTLKAVGISGASFAAMGFTGKAQGPDDGGSFFFTLIEKPLTVLTTSWIAGGVYGLVYSTFNDIRAYQKQNLDMNGPIGQDRRKIMDATRAKLEEKLQKQAREEAIGQDGTIDQDQYELTMANLRQQTGFHRMEVKPEMTKTDVFNDIIQTTLQEASEGLGVGISITLLPAFLYGEITGMINAAIMQYDAGVQTTEITQSLFPRIINDIALGGLGGYFALRNLRIALEQRSSLIAKK